MQVKHVYRFSVILAVSLLGELLNALLPLPIPASVYGLVLMLAGLAAGLFPVEEMYSTGRFLIDIMPVMFIPYAVGLMNNWDVLRDMLLPVTVIMLISTFVVMGVSGRVTQALLNRNGANEKGKNTKAKPDGREETHQ